MPHPALRTLALTLPLLLAACSSVPTPTDAAGGGRDSRPQVSTSLPKDALLAPDVEVKLKVSDDDRVTRVQWVLDEGTSRVRSGEFGEDQIKSDLTLSLGSLAGGAHTLKVTVTDSAGQTTSQTYAFTVDAVVPGFTALTLNGTAVAEGGTVDLAAGTPATLVAAAADDRSGATVYVLRGTEVLAQGSGSVTADLSAGAAGSVEYKAVAMDAVGNMAVRTFTVNYRATTSGKTPAPTPVLTINTAGTAPYSGSLSVTVAGNYDATSTVDRIILEVTDANGNVDNTTYVSNAPTATFSVDTSKYVDGNLTLRAIALTKEGLRGETAIRTVQIRNVSAPTLTILSPDTNATLTGPATVRVQLRQGNTPFTLQSLDSDDNDVRLGVRDFRGQIVKTVFGKAQKVSDGVYEAYLPLDLISSDFSSNAYTLEVGAAATLADGSVRTLGSAVQISTQVSDNKPPALSVLMPAYIVDPYTNANVRGILSRNSALMLQASDDNGVSSLRVDFVCDDVTKLAGQECPRAPYSYNVPVGEAGIFFRVFEIGALLDAQPYVQNGNYTLRVTAYDGRNANIQEFPVRVSRAAVDSDIANLASQSTVDNVVYDSRPGELNIVSARWIIPGTTANPVRVATLAYDNTLNVLIPSRQRIDPVLPAGTSIQVTQGFSEPGSYRIDYIVEDLVTGVTRYYQGGIIVVKKNAN